MEFNLVPENLRHKSKRAVNWLRVGTIFAVAATTVAISWSVLNHMSLAIDRRELESQRPSIVSVENLERQLREARRENQRLSDEIAGLQGLGDGGATERFMHFLGALSAETGDGILLEALEYNRGGSIVVAGVSLDANEISRYFERVKLLPGVQDAALSQLRRPAGEESELRRFELRLEWQSGG